jgi:hypothetical protein
VPKANTLTSCIPKFLLIPIHLSKRDVILSLDNLNTISRIISGILNSDTSKDSTDPSRFSGNRFVEHATKNKRLALTMSSGV